MTLAKHIAREEQNQDPVDAPILPEVSTTPAENVEMSREITEDIEVLDDASASLEDMLSIHRVCYKQASEGLISSSGKLLLISTEHICNRLGISLKHEMPALEHFGSTHTKSQATQISVETIGETISRIFTAFIEMLKNVVTKIFDFLKGIWGEAEQKRVEQYQSVIKDEIDRLKKCKVKPDNEVITNQRLLAAFADPVKGIDDESVKRILKNAEEYCEFLIEASKPMSTYFDEMGNTLKDFIGELNQQNFATFVFGERLEERVGHFLENKFNKEFEQEFDKNVKSKEAFDVRLIQGCDTANIDGDVRASGLLANGVRFAYYMQKSTHAMSCEQIQQVYKYDSADDTIYKLPSLDLANEINLKLVNISSLMAKLSAVVNQKHSRMESDIKRQLSSALATVNQAEKKIAPEHYNALYISVQVAMQMLKDVFEFYKNSYANGLVVIKNTSDCGNMMSKEIVSRYQEIQRKQD